MAKQADGFPEVIMKEWGTGKTICRIPNNEMLVKIREEGVDLLVRWQGKEGLVKKANTQASAALQSAAVACTPVTPPPAAKKPTMLETVRSLITTGAVRFCWLMWILDLAARGEILKRRQEMPEDAFPSVGEVIRALDRPKANEEFVVVSYGWLSRLHPDSRGEHLHSVTEAMARCDGFKFTFWDFISLHQLPRSAEENALFRTALNAMHCLYGLQLKGSDVRNCWYVYRLMDVPRDAENAVPYDGRG